MNKKNIAICIIGILCSAILFGILHNNDKTNGLEAIICKVVRIQYGWGFSSQLEELCTDEFINNSELEDIYKGRKLYSIDDPMIINDYGDIIKVSVHVYCPDIIIHNYTLIKKDTGDYLISDIEYDI